MKYKYETTQESQGLYAAFIKKFEFFVLFGFPNFTDLSF